MQLELCIPLHLVNISPRRARILASMKAEGIAWCSAFLLTSVLIVVGNLLTIVLFAVNKTLHKKSLFLVINMAFADLILGTVSISIYTYEVGARFELWTGGMSQYESLSFFHLIVDTLFFIASLISATFISCERFYAIYWPFKHRTLSMRAYRIVIFMVWALAVLLSAVFIALSKLTSGKTNLYAWTPFALALTFVICGCNIGI